MVHGIIKSHEGVIDVESHVGQGTTFRLYFPAEAQAETLNNTAAVAMRHGHNQKILVVDDETALTSMLQKMLHRLDYDATTRNRADGAIRLVRENPARFDLVITDLTMPEINGLEVASQLNASRPDLPVVLVSGYSASLSADKLHEAGIAELLAKPVTLSVQAEVVNRNLPQV